ncbi:hypothetical protein ATCC90586_009743 [Pythium insidiosum]|nr:hypothetical protein ATCC90586_009743 [Pythium insidiosum]
MADDEDAATAAQLQDDGADGSRPRADPKSDARVAQALGSFSVAEDLCAAWLSAFVDDLTSEFQVREDNDRCLRVASSAAWRQIADGCTLLLAAWPEATLDSSGPVGPSRPHAVSSSIREDDEQNEELGETPSTGPPRGIRDGDDRQMLQVLRVQVDGDGSDSDCDELSREAPVPPPLDTLWHVLSTRRMWVESRLALFPSSRFRASAVPSVGRAGEWELPVEDLAAFLRDVVAASSASVLSEGVSALVVQRNAPLLAKKRQARSRLQLQHVELCVQSALLASEAPPPPPHYTPFFATELSEPPTALLLVGLHTGDDVPRLEVDRSAPGALAFKALAGSTLAKQQGVARDIIRMLKRGSFKSSKWDELRKRVLTTPDRQHVAIAVETSMAVAAPASRRASSVGRKKTAATAATNRPSPLAVEPDAATLSNIFSLGTPRQLTADELARRNDILAVLEREEQRATRKLAVSSFTALTGIPPPTTVMDDSDKVWRDYTAAVSSVTLTGEACVPPGAGATAHASGDAAEKKKKSGKRRADRTKFDLALEAPEFEVTDGNTPARRAVELASVSPIKRSRHRGASPAARLASPSVPVSPVATAAATTPGHGQLPQLDTSRLAAGVKAVIRGVEKRGPRPSPSRNSRLRLHNYHTTPAAENAAAATPSPPKTPHQPPPSNASPSLSSHLPPVSPIKASPHRKHVAFAASPPESEPSKPSPQPPRGAGELSRRYAAKQATWENRTSPPRVRALVPEDEEQDHDHDQDHHQQQQQQQQPRHQRPADWRPPAPRRHLVAHAAHDDDGHGHHELA